MFVLICELRPPDVSEFMELEGRLNTALTLPEVLQFLSMGRMTGTLTITFRGQTVLLYLRQGKLVNSTSVGRPRRLGLMLVDRGRLTRSQLEQAMAMQAERHPQPFLGQVLIEGGFIAREDLIRIIRLQLEEEIWDLCSMPEGGFKFEHGEERGHQNVLVELDIEPLIIEGTRRQDEWARIRKTIPNEDAVPHVAKPEEEFDRDMMTMSDNEWSVLALVNGQLNVGAICNRSGVGRFETYRILNSFIVSGYVTLRIHYPGGVDPSGNVADMFSADELHRDPSGAQAHRASAGRDSARMAAVIGETPSEFKSPASFAAWVANQLLGRIARRDDFYLDSADDVMAETFWRDCIMQYPRADLVKASENLLITDDYDEYLTELGAVGLFPVIEEDTMDAMRYFMQKIETHLAQRVGPDSARSIIAEYITTIPDSPFIHNAASFIPSDFIAESFSRTTSE